MGGCLDECYLYWEEYSILYADDETQVKIEKEIENFKKGKPYNPSVLKDAVKRICLGGYIKEPDKLKEKCKHYRHYPGNLTVTERINILRAKGAQKWKRITLIVSIAGLVISTFFAFLNFSKPSSEELKKENTYLKERIIGLDKMIKEKNEAIDKLKQELRHNEQGDKNE